MTTINFQRTYSLGRDYKGIKDRATKILGANSEYFDIVDFGDVDDEVTFRTECLIPIKKTTRPSVMLLFSNPHPHSVQQGMFLSPNTKKQDNLFWSTMIDAGWFSIPEDKRSPSQLRDVFLNLEYTGPFDLLFCCYYAFPTCYPDDILKIFGRRFFDRHIQYEAYEGFQTILGETQAVAVVTFNKNIFNLISNNRVTEYIDQLDKGEIIRGRNIQTDREIPVYLTYPTGWRYHKKSSQLRKANLEMIKADILEVV
ncbi:MAG: hypothetical protein GY845_00285 [Planctomycetes bacterium]|nr:hypothetical protein [Planctomycetota bacterium]